MGEKMTMDMKVQKLKEETTQTDKGSVTKMVLVLVNKVDGFKVTIKRDEKGYPGYSIGDDVTVTLKNPQSKLPVM